MANGGEVSGTERSPRGERKGPTNRREKNSSLFCLDTTTGGQRALSADFVIPSAISFLFLAINVLMLQNRLS